MHKHVCMAWLRLDVIIASVSLITGTVVAASG